MTFNRVGDRNNAQRRLDFGTSALAAINGDTSATATQSLFLFNCQVNLGACLFGGPPDKQRLAPYVLGYIAVQTNTLTYLDAAPQPEEMLDTLTGTVRAISQGSGAFGGGDGEPGGTVRLTNTAAVGSTGDYSAGLLAKSVGGTGVWSINVGLFTIPIYTNGGAAGPVTVDNRAAITTGGVSSPAIAALSIGGLGVQGGRGGDVSVTTTGNLTTAGSGAHGVLAESIGGRSINDSPNVTGGVAGRILVTVKAAIVTTGAKAYGVLARSLGGEGSRATAPPASMTAPTPAAAAAIPARCASTSPRAAPSQPRARGRMRWPDSASAARAARAAAATTPMPGPPAATAA
uniref:Uncharacterized protein n=1 Tax=Phenylobacterium glaciei TaxID=2803784 RepID=A0A974P3Y4_9CAUL|nr:hypothetical protein JKL49_25180 [Phenylobacterium glaciei]